MGMSAHHSLPRMIANLSAEDQVRALCQLCGFRVVVMSDPSRRPIEIHTGYRAIGTDDCYNSSVNTAWDYFCYRSWESALKGIATFRPASA